LAPAARMLPAIRELSNTLGQHVGERASNLSPLLSAAQVISAIAGSQPAGDGADATDEVSSAPVPVATGGRLTGVASRQDVYAALDMACEFLERTEPSNPAPLLIRRAQAMLD